MPLYTISSPTGDNFALQSMRANLDGRSMVKLEPWEVFGSDLLGAKTNVSVATNSDMVKFLTAYLLNSAAANQQKQAESQPKKRGTRPRPPRLLIPPGGFTSPGGPPGGSANAGGQAQPELQRRRPVVTDTIGTQTDPVEIFDRFDYDAYRERSRERDREMNDIENRIRRSEELLNGSHPYLNLGQNQNGGGERMLTPTAGPSVVAPARRRRSSSTKRGRGRGGRGGIKARADKDDINIAQLLLTGAISRLEMTIIHLEGDKGTKSVISVEANLGQGTLSFREVSRTPVKIVN